MSNESDVPLDRRDHGVPEHLRLRSISPALTVGDIDASLAWYRDVVGFHVKETWEHEGKVGGVSLVAGAAHLILAQDDWAKGRDRAKGEGVPAPPRHERRRGRDRGENRGAGRHAGGPAGRHALGCPSLQPGGPGRLQADDLLGRLSGQPSGRPRSRRRRPKLCLPALRYRDYLCAAFQRGLVESERCLGRPLRHRA